MTKPSPETATQLLAGLSQGDQQAAAKLLPLVYEELRSLAAQYMRAERRDHTLQPTALVHEAYVRLIDRRHASWQDRSHFLGVAAQAMRCILVDHARNRRAAKRGGDRRQLLLNEAIDSAEKSDEYLVALDEALTELAALDSRQAQVVELRFFGGLTVEETAKLLAVSEKTVKRDWAVAKGWLHREITKG